MQSHLADGTTVPHSVLVLLPPSNFHEKLLMSTMIIIQSLQLISSSSEYHEIAKSTSTPVTQKPKLFKFPSKHFPYPVNTFLPILFNSSSPLPSFMTVRNRR